MTRVLGSVASLASRAARASVASVTTVSLLAAAALLAACGDTPPGVTPGPDGGMPDPDGGMPPQPDGGTTVEDPEGCPPMYRQDLLPTYELRISEQEWAAMTDEFLHRAQREAEGLNPKPYHPADFTYVAGDQRIEVPDVRIRLKGNSSWWQTIAFDTNPKMQFVISFNETNPDGRFLGVRKLELDMPRTDLTYFKQRLGLRALRQMGVPAQCANNARVVINGAYYGLYTNLERFDKELLQRVYGHDDADGDLWQGGRVIETNEDSFTWDRLDAFWGVQSVAQLDAVADLDASLEEWAAEMMISDSDGYANGYANFMVYDHPVRGFIWMPQDLDTVFDKDFMPAETSPVFAPSAWPRWELDWYHYLLVMNDRGGFDRFVNALATVRGKLDPAALQADIDAWRVQIADAVEDDPHRYVTTEEHEHQIDRVRHYITDRAVAIDAWLACRQGSGGADRDGDGYDLCHDCDELHASVNPGVVEACNMVDDNCNGQVDDMPPAVACP